MTTIITNFNLFVSFQDLVPQNIIGYLADSPNRRHLVLKVSHAVIYTNLYF